jgi:hypothetical protein
MNNEELLHRWRVNLPQKLISSATQIMARRALIRLNGASSILV